MNPTLPPENESTAGSAAASAPPDWFRDVVWESLLGALCPLIPVPFVDDLALVWTRRRMVSRIAQRHRLTVLPAEVRRVAGSGKEFSCLMLLFKVVIYPFRKLLRKLLYFLSIKDAVDTFSLLFHQGYLLHHALELRRDACRTSTPAAEAGCSEFERCGRAVLQTLEEVDTKPLGRTLRSVLRGSRDLVASAVRFVTQRVFSRRSFERVAEQGEDAKQLAAASPETSQLLDRLLVVLWGEAAYRERLRAQLAGNLGPAEGKEAT